VTAPAEGRLIGAVTPAARGSEELSPEEFDRRVNAPLTEEEVAEVLALERWFTRRYPTVSERFAYVRRKVAEWTRPAEIVESDP
jgi:hypothetical protein